jgi:hypothetical protein
VPDWHVTSVEPREGHRLFVSFADGLAGEVEMEALVTRVDAGVFEALREPRRFQAASIEHGAVSWPGGIDLAPDALHAAIKAEGRCILR